MGREALCNGQLGRESGGVLAQLESHELRIRGDFNATLSFSDLRFARVEGEILEAETPQGHLRLSLGLTEARKWLDRISNPPSLAKKLGVLRGIPVHVVGTPPEITAQLVEMGADRVEQAEAKLAFIAILKHEDLKLLDGLVRYLPEGAQIWVLRTKGSRAMVKESEIMALLRSRRFAPSKTAAWSELYSADRYSRSGIPR